MVTKAKFLTCAWLCLSLLSSAFAGPPAQPALSVIIYDDALAQGWQDWSWAQVNLSASAPVHSGSRSIAASFGAWQGLYLHKPDVDTLGVTHLRFYIHGGGSGGQSLNVFLNLEVNGAPQNGPAVAIPPPAAGAWSEVQIPLSELNPGGAVVSGITWQDATGGGQPALYLDDIALVSAQDPDGPQLSEASLFPRSIPTGGSATLQVRVRVSDAQGAGDIASVTLDASALGVGSVALRDDGMNGDGGAGDGLYGAALAAAPGTLPGEVRLLLTALDQSGHLSSLGAGALNVLAPPGGAIPVALPQRIGWGSNAWDEAPGADWQVNSGVPWDYVYQYITYGWETWGVNYVSRFVSQAWAKNFTPVVTVYLMLGVPPGCGESSSCYAQKLQNAPTVQAYLESLGRAAQQAQGAGAVIFNLEPDFFQYMQQLSNSGSPPPGVRPNDPGSFPVALNKNGYPNTLAGFGRYVVDMIHATAPNALVAPMASMWATNSDPQSVSASGAMQMGRSTAAFIDAMGGAQADLLVVEWSDRDAGSGLRPWWDDRDQETPRPTRAILWENALSSAAHKRLLLWQMPAGNMSLNDTCEHFRDNRAAYAFAHPRDLFEAGVIGVLFGGGADCMTQVWSDGGFIAAQGASAYAAPAAPGGLQVVSASGPFVALRWDENGEPDLWGYRLQYRQGPAGAPYSLDLGRRNAYRLLLPFSGSWEIRLAAVDAMGRASPLSAALMASTSEDARRTYLPVIGR